MLQKKQNKTAFRTCKDKISVFCLFVQVLHVNAQAEILYICHLCTVIPCKNKVQKYTNKCITQPQHHVFILAQATGLHSYHRPHFVWPGNGGEKNPRQSRLGMPPHLCHHRQVPWLAGDLPWCKVGIYIPSTAMRRMEGKD